MDKFKEACLQSGNFTTALIPYYSQVIVEENSDKVRMLRKMCIRDRTIAAPYEISAAIIMSVVGGPFFILLLRRSRQSYG